MHIVFLCGSIDTAKTPDSHLSLSPSLIIFRAHWPNLCRNPLPLALPSLLCATYELYHLELGSIIFFFLFSIFVYSVPRIMVIIMSLCLGFLGTIIILSNNNKSYNFSAAVPNKRIFAVYGKEHFFWFSYRALQERDVIVTVRVPYQQKEWKSLHIMMPNAQETNKLK